MLRFFQFALVTACLLAGGCAPTAAPTEAGDAARMERYKAEVRAKGQPGKKRLTGFRWPNGNGFTEEEKVVEIIKVDARTNAFGQRELKCRITTEVSRWKTVDGKKVGTPEKRRESEERWLPAG